MADRVPIDLSDLRERVESARTDVWWKELSLSKKVRMLVMERLQELELQRQAPKSITEVAQRNREILQQRMNPFRVDELAAGDTPTEVDLVRIAYILDMDENFLHRLKESQEKGADE